MSANRAEIFPWNRKFHFWCVSQTCRGLHFGGLRFRHYRLQPLLLRFARFHLSSSRSLPLSLTKNRAKSTIAKNGFKVRGKAIHHVKVKKINFPKTYNLFTFWGITKFCVITCTASTLRKCSYLVSDFKAWNSIQWNTYHFDSDDNFSSGCRNVSQCHLKQSFSGLHSPGRSYFT